MKANYAVHSVLSNGGWYTIALLSATPIRWLTAPTRTFTPHDLRNTTNSPGGTDGMGEKVGSERMRHADNTITRRVYTHTIDRQARDGSQDRRAPRHR